MNPNSYQDSRLINILSLEKQYQLILNQYEQAYQTYINLLNNNVQTIVTNYNIEAGQGKNCSGSGSSGRFPDGMWEKNVGYYPQKQCKAICDENPYCSGYNLGAKDSNDNFSCSIFADTNTQVINKPNANGCYRKKNFVKPSNLSTTNIQQQFNNNNKFAEFISIPGKNFWGTAPLNQGTVDSLEQCESMCISDLNCTGATFQSSNNICFTRAGMAEIVNGKSTDYALIPQVRQILNTLQNLNNQLLGINQQIDTHMEALYPIAEKDKADKNAKQLELNDSYSKLLEEKYEIMTSLQEYETLEKENDINSLTVNQQNIMYKFWTLLAIFLLAIIFQVIFKLNGSSFIYWIMTVLSIMIFISLDWWSLIPIILLPFLFKLIYYPS